MTIRSQVLIAILVALSSAAACGDDTNDASGTDPSETAVEAGEASLDIHYEHPDADVDFDYRIECGADDDVTGDAERAEVEASAACDALTEPTVVERLVEGPDHDVCTEIYGGPDIAEVSGTVGDSNVDTIVDRADGCSINDWDEVLADLLPPAIGASAEPGA